MAQYHYIDISAISPLHELRDLPYHAALVESLEKKGWQGRPLLGVQCDPKVAWDAVEHNGCSRTKVTLLTGSHRYGSLLAVKKRGKWPFNLPRNHVPVVVLGPKEFKEDGWERIRGATTDPDRLRILQRYARDPDAVLLMEEELKSNRRTTRIVNARHRKNLFGFGKRTTHSPKLLSAAHEAGRKSGDTKQFSSWWSKQSSDPPPSATLKRRAEQRYRAGVESLWSERAKETKAEASSIIEDVTEALAGQGMKRAEAASRAKKAFHSGDTFDSLFRKVMKRANPSGKYRQMSLGEITKYTGTMRDGAVTLRWARLSQALKMQKRWGGEIIDVLDSTGKHVNYVVVVKRAENPAKFDRCVADVKKSLKAQKRPGNAYAICTASGTRNPKDMGFKEAQRAAARQGYRHVDTYKTKATANEVALNYKPSKVVQRGQKWEVWTQQKLNPKALARTQRSESDTRLRHKRQTRNPAYYVVDEQYKMIVVHSGPYGSAAKANIVARKQSPRFTEMSYRELQSKEEHGYDVHRYSGSKEWWGSGKRSNASARARRKTASHARKPRKAPTTKRTKVGANPRVVWSAKQGKLKAVISKSLMGNYQVRIMGGPRVLEEFSPKKFDEAVAIARLRLADSGMQRGNPVHDLIPGAGTILKIADKTGQAWKSLGKRVARGVSKTFHPSKSRKNPMDVALKRYEEFHGMPSEEILEFEEKEHHHSAKVGLGQLVSILVTLINGRVVPLNSPGFSEKGSNGRMYWEFDQKTPIVKRVYLTSSEDGRQLFIDGGDQSIPTDALRALGITADDEHDHMLIGTIKMVTYRTRKTFEDKGKNELDFFHKFGGEGSRGVAPVLLYFKRSQKLRVAGGRYKIAPPRKDLGSVSPGIVG